MILLLSATPLETTLIRKKLVPAEPLPGGFTSYRGRLQGQNVRLVQTGIGKSNASAAAALAFSLLRPRQLINFGCAGAFPEAGLNIGDLALASCEIFGDEGVAAPGNFLDMEALGLPLFQHAGETLFNRFPLDSKGRELAVSPLEAVSRERGCQWREGAFVTVSTCSGNDLQSREILLRTDALCENMEGAAIAHVACRFNTPMIEIRGISNLTGDRDLSTWNLETACVAAEEAVTALLARLPLLENFR